MGKIEKHNIYKKEKMLTSAEKTVVREEGVQDEKIKEEAQSDIESGLQTTLDGLKGISRVDLCVLDTEGIMLATTFPDAERFRDSELSFVNSPADSQVVSGCEFY